MIEVMNEKGADYFRNMEYDFLKQISTDSNAVISPAGSIIFQKDAMDWILNNSHVIFLNTPLEIIGKRLEVTPKAVAGLKERGIQSIYNERLPIYNRFASLVVNTTNKKVNQVVEEIICNLK